MRKIIIPLAATMLMFSVAACTNVTSDKNKLYHLSDEYVTSSAIWEINKIEKVLTNEGYEVTKSDDLGTLNIHANLEDCSYMIETYIEESNGETYIHNPLYDTQYELYSQTENSYSIQKQYISSVHSDMVETIELLTAEYVDKNSNTKGIISTKAVATDSLNKAVINIHQQCETTNVDNDLHVKILDNITLLADKKE